MTAPTPRRFALLCTVLLSLLVGVAACDGGDDPSPSTPSVVADGASEWAVPSLPPSTVVDDSDVLRYVRVLQELTQAARANGCDTAWNLVDPDQVGGDRDRFCELYLPGLAEFDLNDGTLTFKDHGTSGDPAEISADFVRDASSSITLRTDDEGDIRVSRLSVLS